MFWKKKEVKEKYDCVKKGHYYIVVDDYPFYSKDEFCGINVLLQCGQCLHRRTLLLKNGKIDPIINMWESGEISDKERIRLTNLTNEIWKERKERNETKKLKAKPKKKKE